jgi:NhaP-type Na+/H+ or K+/H+ antiporter
MVRVFLQLGGWIGLTALALVTLVAGGMGVASLGNGPAPAANWLALVVGVVAAIGGCLLFRWLVESEKVLAARVSRVERRLSRAKEQLDDEADD